MAGGTPPLTAEAPPRLRLTDTPDPATQGRILQALIASNEARAGPSARQPLAILLEDQQTGETMGGLFGRTAWRWLTIETLFIPPPLRAAGLGRRLVAQAEAEAIRRDCIGAWVDTFSHQAPGFYECLGYRRFAGMEDHPPGYHRIFLRKPLGSAAG